MSEIQSWSGTAANNNSASPDGWPENMAYSGVNNSARENMAALAKWRLDNNGSLTTAGTSTAYTVTTNATWAAYATGMTLVVRAHTANTGACTINVSALGAKAIRDVSGTALAAGVIATDQLVYLVYNATDGYFRMIGGWLRNSGGAVAGNVTVTGVVTQTLEAVNISEGGSTTISDNTGTFLHFGTATRSAATLTMPANPVDGMVLRLGFRGAITALTHSPNAGQSLRSALTATTADSYAAYVWSNGLSTWYRVG